MSLILIDTSVWARIRQPAVADAVAEALESDAVAISPPIALELLRSARNARELENLASSYDALHQIPLTPDVTRRAREVQAALAATGHHRGPSPVDLLTAAAAESVNAEVWHCDRDFELIAKVTRQRIRRHGK